MTKRQIDIQAIVAQLARGIEANRILTTTADLASFSYDASFGSYLPQIVCQPMHTDEVVHIVQVANEYQMPLVPRGRGTSLSGGPLPVEGGIVLDFSLWNTTLDISPDDLTVVVSPGVITASINEAAERYGLMYPPDPSSSHVATIGGNLAENAGGPKGLKYGVTKHFVLGLEVVTADGRVLRTGGKTVKNVTGYDLTSLIVGSEGTLAIITEATLRLVPKPLATKTALIVFDDIEDAGRAISTVLTSGVLPSKMEIMDQFCIQAVEDYKPLGLPVDAAAILLVELDGHPNALEEEMVVVQRACESVMARSVTVAQNEQEARELWQARKLVSPAIVKFKPTKISEDATVPRSQIPAMFRRLKEIREKYDVHLVIFGHAGDGNLHPNIIADKRDKEEMKRVERAVEEIFEAALALGGTLSGEHGIGTMKAPFLENEVGHVGLEFLQLIKDAWDPHHLLNPGKIFPTPGQRLVLTNE